MQSFEFLITLGAILLLGLLTSTLGHKTFLPRVTLLLIFGIILGSEGLNVIPPVFADRFELVADIALLMVGFLIGGRLTYETISHASTKILAISICAALLTTALVTAGLAVAGVSLEIAILLGCIAAATAPAAILDVVFETDSKGPFKDILVSIVALDDVWALILFAIGTAIVSSMNGHALDTPVMLLALKDIGGAIVLGLLIGIPAAYLTGRIKPGQPILTEALAIVFLCGGLALWLEVSFLIASIVMGAMVTNLARHHEYPFHAIEGIEAPFMVLFFVLAGASLELGALRDVGIIGLVYILCRSMGKVSGGWLGSLISHTDTTTRQWMGAALLPQAGVAIGMALVASNRFPEYSQVLLSITISSTIFFEIIGPIFTRLALRKADK